MNENIPDLVASFKKSPVQFFLGPRPGKKSKDTLAALELTHCCTLLSEREDVQPIRKICQSLGCEWIWLPFEGGRLDVLKQSDVIGHLTTFFQSIATVPEPRIYFHCSAGIHRTGFFVYLLLRLKGLTSQEAFSELSALRPVTADQVGEERLDLADQFYTEIISYHS